MKDKALQVLATTAFAAAAIVVVLGLGGPVAVLADLGVVDTHRASAAAPDIAPHGRGHGKTGAQKQSVDARYRAAIAAPGGAYGERTGRRNHTDLIAGARWNPCAPIKFVINPDGARDQHVTDFRIALRKVSTVTGMRLVDAGVTDDYDPLWAEYTDGAVLVNWGTGSHGVLNRGADATAEPVAYRNSYGQLVITGAQITFNLDQDRMYKGGVFGTYGSRIAMYMHEIGHALNLGHVDDADQLMNPYPSAARDFGAGDMAGLRERTTGPCRTM